MKDKKKNMAEKDNQKSTARFLVKKDYSIKQLLKLYYLFAKIGTFTIGGGLAMMPMLQKELIEKRDMVTEEELLDYYAVGQSTPGIIAVNVSTFVGYKFSGVPGGIFATLGMVTPSLVIIMILAGLINSVSDYPIIQRALRGVNVAVAALLTSVIVNFSKKTIKNWVNLLFALTAFSLIFFLKVPSFYIILTAIFVGAMKTIILDKKAKKKEAAVSENNSETENLTVEISSDENSTELNESVENPDNGTNQANEKEESK